MTERSNSSPTTTGKTPLPVEVSGFLQDGPNRIQARIFNDNGPPALWLLSLTGDQLSLRSDHNWIASLRRLGLARSCSCCFAKIPGPGNSIDSRERTISSSLTKVWPLWLLFGAVALVFVWGGNWCA